MRLSNPRRVELRPKRYDQQHRKGLNPIHGPTERFQARGVGPMRILEDHQHRLLDRESSQVVRSELPAFSVGAAAASVRARGNVHRSAATASRQRARRPGVDVEASRQHRIELVELCLRGVVMRKSSGAFHLADDRVKRAVGVLRGAEVAQPRVRLRSEAFQQRGRQSRFADTGLAG